MIFALLTIALAKECPSFECKSINNDKVCLKKHNDTNSFDVQACPTGYHCDATISTWVEKLGDTVYCVPDAPPEPRKNLMPGDVCERDENGDDDCQNGWCAQGFCTLPINWGREGDPCNQNHEGFGHDSECYPGNYCEHDSRTCKKVV